MLWLGGRFRNLGGLLHKLFAGSGVGDLIVVLSNGNNPAAFGDLGGALRVQMSIALGVYQSNHRCGVEAQQCIRIGLALKRWNLTEVDLVTREVQKIQDHG